MKKNIHPVLVGKTKETVARLSNNSSKQSKTSSSSKPSPPKNSSSSVDVALDVASFVPGPVGMGASVAGLAKNLYEGDYEGAAWDAANVVTGGAAKWLKAGAKVAKAAGGTKVASKVASKANFLSKASNPNIYKSAGLARDVRNLKNASTQRSSQKESTFVAPKINPKTASKSAQKPKKKSK